MCAIYETRKYNNTVFIVCDADDGCGVKKLAADKYEFAANLGGNKDFIVSAATWTTVKRDEHDGMFAETFVDPRISYDIAL